MEQPARYDRRDLTAVRLDLGFAIAGIGSFDWDVTTGDLEWDERLSELFGYGPGDPFDSRIESFWKRVHPDDRPRVQAAIDGAMASCGEYEADYRVVLPGGGVRWIAARGRVLCDEEDRPVRMLGAAYDTSGVHSTGDRVARVLETISTAFLSLDRDWGFTYVNAQAERLFGRSRDELLGRRIWDVYPDLVGTATDGAYRRAVSDDRPVTFEQYYAPLDTWFEVRAFPSPDGLSVYFHDVSARLRAEEEARRATGRLQLLSAAGARLAATLEVEEVLATLADVVLSGLGRWVLVALRADLLDDAAAPGAGYPVAHAAHPDTGRQAAIARALRDARVLPRRLPALGLRPQPSLAPAPFDAPTLAALAEAVGEPGGEPPTLTLPLGSRGRLLGALVVGHPTEDPDRTLLAELALRAGTALDNAILFGAERRLALTLQRSLLPAELYAPEGAEIAARYLPGTRGLEVGGDFYAAYPRDDGRLLLVIGDVMGHGMDAAAGMGQLRAALTAYGAMGDPPEAILGRLAGHAGELLDVPMATVLVATYEAGARSLTVASAGHPPPLLAPLDAPPAYVPIRPGPPIGAGPADYASLTVDVPPESTLVLYTDGLVEDRTRPIDEGLDALRECLVDLREPPEAVCEHVLRSLGRLHGAQDDIALLVFNHG